MAALPRIVTVDPTGKIARIVRAATELMDLDIVLIDMPGSAQALDEIARGRCNLLITSLELDDDMKGIELALRVKQTTPETNVVILADVNDAQLDEETLKDSPFVYLHRPVDTEQFMRVMDAGMNGGDIFAALSKPAAAEAAPVDFGPVPEIDLNAARGIVNTLLRDLGAMAITFVSRNGDIIMESGASGYLNREQLAGALLPLVMANIQMKELVGGQSTTLQFYDGDTYDVYVLSVGMHHFLCPVFDGQVGSRQFGAVNRFGRKAVEDLIALLGANAFMIEKRKPAAVSPSNNAAAPREEPKKKIKTLPKRETVEQAAVASVARVV
ncbi:MAG: response regulator transcription factor, partial [Burkholderiales bacterium]|nr:response regulator transcription factor [Anaerolineae bacterium]